MTAIPEDDPQFGGTIEVLATDSTPSRSVIKRPKEGAFLVGGGLLVIGAKFWVFTLGAVGAISDAALSTPVSILMFLLFVALAEVAHLTVVGIAVLMPGRSGSLLDAMSAWLTRHNRMLVIVLGAVFGTWFLVKALNGLHVL